MAGWSEIERVRRDPDAARTIARGLLHYVEEPGALTGWEADFLESTASTAVDELTARWAEKLLDIRDSVQRITAIRGFSVKSLLNGCFEARQDLDDEDAEWIAQMWRTDRNTIRRKYAGRLLRCARRVQLVEPYH